MIPCPPPQETRPKKKQQVGRSIHNLPATDYLHKDQHEAETSMGREWTLRVIMLSEWTRWFYSLYITMDDGIVCLAAVFMIILRCLYLKVASSLIVINCLCRRGTKVRSLKIIKFTADISIAYSMSLWLLFTLLTFFLSISSSWLIIFVFHITEKWKTVYKWI